MKTISLIITFLLLLSYCAFSQEYFQQEVNHKIDVTLDNKSNSLSGHIETEYVNNSPDTLNFIYYHLWPNAYKNNNTKFAQQQLMFKRTDFQNSDESSRGYIDSLNFIVNEQPVELILCDNNIDIGIIYLKEPLLPQDTINISTSFYVKIPAVSSRLGQEDGTYCITQWYPKPAVYDKNGWNQMPYLDMGEFYSEFGNIEVNISLPDDYIVAATGNLQNKKELTRLEDYAKLCNASKYKENLSPFGDSEKDKTLTYFQKNIHDFAWFASKDFGIERDYIKLDESGKTVFCWAFYNKYNYKLWQNSTKYIKQAISYYSKVIGEYPYSNCTVVDGPLSAGGGMEYPTITVVTASSKSSLENVIIHEIGHNWFYGMLASNERMHPWIDEGFTSFYESKYYDNYYPGQGLIEQFMGMKKNPQGLNDFPPRFARELAWMYLVKENSAQSSELSSEEMSMTNYFIMSYYKPVSALYALEKYLGAEKFETIMKDFFKANKFKHIYPETITEFFKDNSDMVSEEYFTDLIYNNNIPDYKISRVKADSIVVKNNTSSKIPLFLYFGDSLVIEDGFFGKKKFLIPENTDVTIDKYYYSPDLNRNNNYYRSGFLKSNRPLKIRFANILDNPKYIDFPFLPVIGYNTSNGLMAGLMFYTSPVPKRKIECQIVPLYGIKSNTLAGKANLSYYIQPQKTIVREYELFTKSERFGVGLESRLSRIRMATGIKIKFRTDLREFYESQLSFRNVTATDFYSGAIKNYQHLQYIFSDSKLYHPWGFQINAERGAGFIKTYGEINKTYSYQKKNKGLSLRLFMGKFLYSRTDYYGNYNFRLSGNLGSQDYLYDNLFVGRANEIRQNPENLWSHQFIRNDGGFTMYTPFGQTDNWLLAININTTTPFRFVDLYANIGSCPSISEDKNVDTYYEAGIKLKIWEDFICIYLPIKTTPEVWEASNNFYTVNYFQKIRFTLSLEKINILKYREKPYLLF